MSFQKWFFAYNFFSSGPRGLKFGMTLRSIKIAQHAKFQPFRSIRKRIRAFFWLKMHISRDIALKSSGLVASMFHQTLKSHFLNIASIAIYKSTYKISDWANAIAEKCRFLPEYLNQTLSVDCIRNSERMTIKIYIFHLFVCLLLLWAGVSNHSHVGKQTQQYRFLFSMVSRV